MKSMASDISTAAWRNLATTSYTCMHHNCIDHPRKTDQETTQLLQTVIESGVNRMALSIMAHRHKEHAGLCRGVEDLAC